MPPRIPAEIFPPGEFIRDELNARGMDAGGSCRDHGTPRASRE